MIPSNLNDSGIERALIGSIMKHGKNALIDVSDIVMTTDLVLPLNQIILKCMKDLSDDGTCETFDIESIRAKASALGYSTTFDNPKTLEYLELITNKTFDKDRIRSFGMHVKKLSVARELYQACDKTQQYLKSVTGSETLSEIIANSEKNIVEYTNGIDAQDGLSSIGDDIISRVDQMMNEPSIDQVGLPTGFPKWDAAIGGGLRRGTVNVKGARPKTGKTMDAMNCALNVSSCGIPTLYLDTEMTKTDQQSRLICIDSGCPINMFEHARFKDFADHKKNVAESAKRISKLPLQYVSIAGKSPDEVLNLIRRWLVRCVGFNEQGKANDCVIVYDYLKLTSGEGLSSFTPEYILLGLMLTKMHDFAVKYGLPFLAYVQLNRDGIGTEDTSVIAGSDRILWLCSNLSILKNKDENDTSMGCGSAFGNKKIVVLETRHGPGLEQDDYINIKAKMRPGVPATEASGKMEEGHLFSAVKNLGPIVENQQNNH